ncbi:hypothetical protein LOTGIDRAFT_119983, partial [Lottia gigantea]
QYGQIHIVIRQMVIAKFGQEMWETILKKSELDDRKHFLVFSQYDDNLWYKVVQSVSQCTDLSVNTVLEIFGDYFIMYAMRHGYDKMLKTLGSDMWHFIQNLDSLHSLLALSYKNIIPPSFRCEHCDNGDLLLHYYSTRKHLYPLVIGLIRAVGRDIFKQRVEITVQDNTSENIAGKIQTHVTFKVLHMDQDRSCARSLMKYTRDLMKDIKVFVHVKLFKSENGADDRLCADENASTTSETSNTTIFDMCPMKMTSPAPFQLSTQQFCTMFPYHFIFDKRMIIKQSGYQIQKLSPLFRNPPVSVSEVFQAVHPKTTLTIDNIRKFINSVFFISVRKENDWNRIMRDKEVTLKGQMIWLKETEHMVFMGSLRITSLNDLVDMNVFISDIPLYDVTRELILLYEQRKAEIDFANKLDETTAELKKTSRALEIEKKKTEMLLGQMLPQNVALQLKDGKQVEAGNDMFYCLACTPLQIVNMLNDLYQRFDQKTDEHGVYKVETIGDAYMIVCGVPEKTTNHSTPVARFAVDMITEARQVPSPHTGRPIQIRVGIHTGPVVAGVVGLKMPRYCLFGDTVNTASRMESHGLPGRIHLSPTTYHSLADSNFLFKERGEINVKGKGKMTTHFLVGETSVIEEPKDKFFNVPAFRYGMEEITQSSVKKRFANVKSRTCSVM